MKPDFFAQLEAELAGFTREGVHLGESTARLRRRAAIAIRRGIAILTLATALAASLDSEFPATARGLPAPAAMVQRA